MLPLTKIRRVALIPVALGLITFSTSSADAARFSFAQPANVSWGVQLGSTSRTGTKPLGSFYSGDLWSIRPNGLASSRVTMLHDVLGYRSATLNLGGGAYAENRNAPGSGQAYTCRSNPGVMSYIPITILPTYGETKGKSVRVTLTATYYSHRSGSGQTGNAARLYYARPGDRTGTALMDVVSYSPVPSRTRTATFNARVGDTFYVASYYGYYCTTNSSTSGELRLAMTVE